MGGGVLASWLIVLCGQTLLALLLVELSNRMPFQVMGINGPVAVAPPMNPEPCPFTVWFLRGLAFDAAIHHRISWKFVPHWVLS